MELPTLTISAGNGWMNQEDRFSGNIAGKEQKNYTLLKRGELSYNHGNSKLAKYGTVFSLQTYEEALVPRVYHSFKVEKGNANFVEYYFATKLPDRELGKLISSGARMDGLLNIGYDDFMGISLLLPKTQEQDCIAGYFRKIDMFITLHQCKCRVLPKLLYNDWEQRKLGEIAIEILAGGDIDKEKVVDDGTYPIYANALTNDGIVGYYNDYYRVKAPAVTVTGRGEVGHAQARMTDFTPVVRLLAIRSNHDCYFLENAINNQNVVVESTGVPQLTVPQLSSYDICFPKDIREEEKIGAYYKKLDNLITLHQRKCEETKKLKKYMLQKMFPQNGQTVPEIRFAGFTDAWEQRKLEDLVDRVTRKNQDLVSELPLTISAQYGLIDQNEFFDKRVASKDVSGYYLIENGEFAYNKSTSTDAPWGAVKRLDRYENGVLSTLYIVFGIKKNNPVDSDFLVSYYSTNLWHKGIHEIAAEGARNHGLLNIAPADFFETELTIPQDIEEQKKIGKYFEELERLITLHQRKNIYF